jgi:molybdopterin-guanine dinucleotide biosynthesis protein A
MKFAGLVLAGGRSSRMKEDKAFVVFQKKTFIERAFHQLQELNISAVFVSGQYSNFSCIVDLWPNAGPAAAILSAAQQLSDLQFTHLLVAPIDMPLLSHAILTYLIDNTKNNTDAVFIKNNPLPCCIKISALNNVLPYYEKKPMIAIKQLLTQYLNYQELSEEEINKEFLLNINTPQELKYLRDSHETKNNPRNHHL